MNSLGIYPPLFTDPDSCFSIYQIRWIKNTALLMATVSSSETFAKRRAIFLSVRKTVNKQGCSKLREPIKMRENCYPLIFYPNSLHGVQSHLNVSKI